MRLTGVGWATLVGAAAMAAAGRILGLTEWYIAAGAIGVVTVLAATWLATRPSGLTVERAVTPRRVGAGDACQVELEISQRSVRASAVTAVDDAVDGNRRMRLLVPPVRAGHPVQTRYRMPTRERGLLRFGPIVMRTSDPFGVWERRVTTESHAEVVVLPRVVALRPIPPAPGEEPEVGRRDLQALQATTDEVSALREFRPGDDVRRVHWPTTARVGTPVVRQYDQPWQRRVTVQLDTDASRTGGAAFERAVTVAASVVASSAADGQLVRLVTPDGTDTDFVAAGTGVDAAMDLLAMVQPSTSGHAPMPLRALAEQFAGGTLVSVWAAIGTALEADLELFEARFAGAIRAVCGSRPGPPTAPRRASRALLVHDGRHDLVTEWSAAVASLWPSPTVPSGSSWS
jgi:uncharacterized protein (DUF58 family)